MRRAREIIIEEEQRELEMEHFDQFIQERVQKWEQEKQQLLQNRKSQKPVIKNKEPQIDYYRLQKELEEKKRRENENLRLDKVEAESQNYYQGMHTSSINLFKGVLWGILGIFVILIVLDFFFLKFLNW